MINLSELSEKKIEIEKISYTTDQNKMPIIEGKIDGENYKLFGHLAQKYQEGDSCPICLIDLRKIVKL